jgi:hypothetical protein
MVLTQDRANGRLWYQRYESIDSVTKGWLVKPTTCSTYVGRIMLQRNLQSSTPRKYVLLYTGLFISS